MSFIPSDKDTPALLYELLLNLKALLSRIGYTDSAGNNRVTVTSGTVAVSGMTGTNTITTVTTVTGVTNLGGIAATNVVPAINNMPAYNLYGLIGRS